MRITYVVVKPTEKRKSGFHHSEAGLWEVLAVAPRGLCWDWVHLATADILEARIVPLSNLRSYGLSSKVLNIPKPLPCVGKSGELWRAQQKIEANKLRMKIFAQT